jgi:hypothetical protein
MCDLATRRGIDTGGLGRIEGHEPHGTRANFDKVGDRDARPFVERMAEYDAEGVGRDNGECRMDAPVAREHIEGGLPGMNVAENESVDCLSPGVERARAEGGIQYF